MGIYINNISQLFFSNKICRWYVSNIIRLKTELTMFPSFLLRFYYNTNVAYEMETLWRIKLKKYLVSLVYRLISCGIQCFVWFLFRALNYLLFANYLTLLNINIKKDIIWWQRRCLTSIMASTNVSSIFQYWSLSIIW